MVGFSSFFPRSGVRIEKRPPQSPDQLNRGTARLGWCCCFLSGKANMEERIKELEVALGHTFAKRDLLKRALTHRSLANEMAAESSSTVQVSDNERLEFLGDAVLGLAVAEALFSMHPGWQEGELTRVRAQLVSRQQMAEVAKAIGLGDYLLLSKGEERSGLRKKTTVLSNSMEAVLGALFVDGGLDLVRAFVRKWVLGETEEQLARELQSGAALGNFKSALQEHLQALKMGSPVYRVKSESGPDHRKRFVVEVRLKPTEGEAGKALACGVGGTKKNAEQDAARLALERLQAEASEAAQADSDSGEGGKESTAE